MQQSKSSLLPPLLWAGIISLFSFLMFQVVWPYTSWEWDVDFLQTKQIIIHLFHYRLAFYTHIFSSLVVLFSGAFLFVNVLLQKWSKLHRWMGKMYVGLVLLISAPSGLVMAFYANGGILSQCSFLILSSLWWYFTYQGFQTARAKNFIAHQCWMMRSYALTLSAVTLRLLQMSLGYLFFIEPELQYILVSWGSWLFNLVIIEIWINRRHPVYENFFVKAAKVLLHALPGYFFPHKGSKS